MGTLSAGSAEGTEEALEQHRPLISPRHDTSGGARYCQVGKMENGEPGSPLLRTETDGSIPNTVSRFQSLRGWW